MNDDLIVVAGGGGFIGGHLIAELRRQNYWRIRSVDIKPLEEWYQVYDEVENCRRRLKDACARGAAKAPRRLQPGGRHGRHGLHREQQGPVHAVGADQHAPAAWPAARPKSNGSSTPAPPASTTPTSSQTPMSFRSRKRTPIPPCRKTATVGKSSSRERMCRHFREDFGLCTRVARFHNVYGPHGTWDGGREKAPAAVCRKVIHALETGNHEIEIWGDGNQTRSFMYIDDCITGINRILSQRHRRADQSRLQRDWSRSTAWSTSSRISPASS